MKNPIFLYTTPFILQDTPANRAEMLSQTVRLTEYERDDELRLRAFVLDYAQRQGLIKLNAAGTAYATNVFDVTASWQWQVVWTNMRSLVDKQKYSDVCMSLQNEDGLPLALLLNLHFQLGTIFDTTLLNTIVNRTMQAVQLIPYDTDKAEDVITWEFIHQATPWIWLVILLQSLIHMESVHPKQPG